MKKFEIESKQGVVMGIYEGDTPEEAVTAMDRDAGYASREKACEILGVTLDEEMNRLYIKEII